MQVFGADPDAGDVERDDTAPSRALGFFSIYDSDHELSDAEVADDAEPVKQKVQAQLTNARFRGVFLHEWIKTYPFLVCSAEYMMVNLFRSFKKQLWLISLL